LFRKGPIQSRCQRFGGDPEFCFLHTSIMREDGILCQWGNGIYFGPDRHRTLPGPPAPR
jgi:hypothetical protein